MNIFILEPIGQRSYLLFDTMEATFRQQGHEFVSSAATAEVCFFDLWNGYGEYYETDVDAVIKAGMPVVVWDFFDQWGDATHRPNWWGFDDCKKLHEKAAKGERWARILELMLSFNPLKVSFTRKLSSSWEYPSWVKPIDCCLYPDHDFAPATLSELMSRTNDFCWIGNSSPWRATAICDLVQRFGQEGIDRQFTYDRIPHAEWLDRHRNARMFIEADGGGYGSERPFQLGTIAPMLKIRNDMRSYAPWTDGVNCIEVGQPDGHISEHEVTGLIDLLRDSPRLYQIYRNGIDHLHQHYSPTARAEYVLNTMAEAGLK